MAALLDQYTAAVGNQDFEHKVRMAILRQVATILREPATTPNHVARATLAARAIHDPASLNTFVNQGVLFLASQDISVASDDPTIINAISPLVDMFALLPTV